MTLAEVMSDLLKYLQGEKIISESMPGNGLQEVQIKQFGQRDEFDDPIGYKL